MEEILVMRLGEFSEFWRDESLPSVGNVLGRMDDAGRRLVGIYLAQGEMVRFTMERLPDVIDGEDVFLTAGLRTDGDWYWRSDLAHYVLKYGIDLPAKFVAHASSNQWRPPVLSEEELRHIAATIRAH